MRDAVAPRRRQWLVPLCLRLQQMAYLFDQPSRQMVLVFVSLVADLKDLCLPRGKPFKGARPGLLQHRRVPGQQPPALRAGIVSQLRQSADTEDPESWSPDGRYLAFRGTHEDEDSGIFVLPLNEEGAEPLTLVDTSFIESDADFSPDGRWIAYSSAESGRSLKSYADELLQWRVARLDQ